VERQAAELAAEADRSDWIEETATAELPEAIAQDLQDEHRRHVEMQRAQAAADARRSDIVADAAAERAEPPRLYVKRGSRHYQPADKARLKPGEPVYVREADGSLQCIGETDSRGTLPEIPIQL
jgi:hypothetical protein